VYVQIKMKNKIKNNKRISLIVITLLFLSFSFVLISARDYQIIDYTKITIIDEDGFKLINDTNGNIQISYYNDLLEVQKLEWFEGITQFNDCKNDGTDNVIVSCEDINHEAYLQRRMTERENDEWAMINVKQNASFNVVEADAFIDSTTGISIIDDREEAYDDLKNISNKEDGTLDDKTLPTDWQGIKEDGTTGRDISSVISGLIGYIKELFKWNTEQDLKIEELESENELIKSELCKKDSTYKWCLGVIEPK